MTDEMFVEETTTEEAMPETETQETSENSLAEELKAWIEEGKDEDSFIEYLHTKHEMSYPKAVRELANLKREAGLTQPRTTHSSEEVQKFIKEKMDEGFDRKDITQMLIDTFGYNKNSAASTMSVQLKKMGITTESVRGARVPIEEVAAFAREHKDKKRSEFAKLMSEKLGYSESTAAAFYTYLPFAIAYAKLECGSE